MPVNGTSLNGRASSAARGGKLLKVVLLGDGGVGKSSLMNRFVSNEFNAQSFHTIGVEFLNKDVTVNQETYTIQIWDTAGQERFKSLRTPFYRGADCCLLTFGLDDLQSFRNLTMWKKEFLYYADVQDGEHFPFVVLGNKCDVEQRRVSAEEAREWCRQNGLVPFFETSAKDAINVDSAFVEAVRQVSIQEKKLDLRTGVDTVSLGPSRRIRAGQTGQRPQRANACC